MSVNDEAHTPSGDPIKTYTMWLDFGDEGEIAITADVTRVDAALRDAQDAVRAIEERPR